MNIFFLIKNYLFSVCTNKRQTKAIIALIFQLFVLFAVIGFLITFICNDFTLCFDFQCDQTSTSFTSSSNNTSSLTFSSTTYTILKRVFIICELVCSVIFIIFSIIYIILFIKCSRQLPRIHPIKRIPHIQNVVSGR